MVDLPKSVERYADKKSRKNSPKAQKHELSAAYSSSNILHRKDSPTSQISKPAYFQDLESAKRGSGLLLNSSVQQLQMSQNLVNNKKFVTIDPDQYN